MKRKKAVLFFSIITIITILIIVLCNISKSYKLEYKKDGYDIVEEYDKELGVYLFSLEHDDKSYEIVVDNKYVNERELIEEVHTYESDEIFCVLFVSSKIETYPVCTKGKEFVEYELLEEVSEEFYKREKPKVVNDNYENLKITSFNSKNYLIWSHDGYYYLDGKDNKKIELFESEPYYNNLAFKVGQYVLTPNYDLEYSFKEIFVINLKNGKLRTWELNYEISYNSYFIGEKDGIAYIVDRKNKVEYSLNPKKEIQEIVSKDGKGIVFRNEWEKVSMTKLINDDYAFEEISVYDYKINDKKLYLEYYGSKNSILVSSQEPDKIVESKKSTVYYLVGDILYMYSPYEGEIELIKYSEWEFNNLNSIFIY